MKLFSRKIFFAAAILLLFLAVTLFKLDEIPGEWFGDISNVHEYEMQVLSGKWPFYFFQSPGPLYHYLIAPIILLYRNHGFETYKVASIVVSLLGLAATYFFVLEISSVTLALLTTITMSVSLWYLIWSRLGNSQIVIPALVAFMSLFIARYVRKKRFPDLLLAAFFASLGWYTYPQTFIFPIVFFLFIVFYLIATKKLAAQLKPLGLVLAALFIMVIPFVNIIRGDKANFGAAGYIGEKVLPNLTMPKDQLISKIASNYKKVLLMLHVRGDGIFRVNVSNHPQIDKISGIFFLLGFLYFAKKGRRIWLFYILWMLLLLPLPSISPAIPDVEIPNSARTIAIVPFVFLLVSAGFLWIYRFLNKLVPGSKYLFIICLCLIYAFAVFSNLKSYFVDYANGLPDHNLAPGKIIAEYIDTLPSDVSIYFSSCCWGQWGEPEPKGVIYQLRKPRQFVDITKLYGNCEEITHRPAVLVTKPQSAKPDDLNNLTNCSGGNKILDIKSAAGQSVARLIFIQ